MKLIFIHEARLSLSTFKFMLREVMSLSSFRKISLLPVKSLFIERILVCILEPESATLDLHLVYFRLQVTSRLLFELLFRLIASCLDERIIPRHRLLHPFLRVQNALFESIYILLSNRKLLVLRDQFLVGNKVKMSLLWRLRHIFP